LNEFNASIILPKIAKGDEDAFRKLYDQFGGYVYKSVILSIRDRAKAEELSQSIWLKLWRFADKYNTSKPFKPWLSRIISNELIDYYRRRKQDKFSIDEMKESGFEPGENVIDTREGNLRRDVKHDVNVALNSITDKQRQVIVLKYYQGFKIKEIAEILGIGQSAVKARLYSGLEALSQIARKGEE
jgi:RNA polymerase sigma-70 factor, ECF subfamily